MQKQTKFKHDRSAFIKLFLYESRFVGALRASPRSLRLPRKRFIFLIGTKSPKIIRKLKGFDLKALVHPSLIIKWEHGDGEEGL